MVTQKRRNVNRIGGRDPKGVYNINSVYFKYIMHKIGGGGRRAEGPRPPLPPPPPCKMTFQTT